jgi:DnaK suppressor protein
MFASFLQILGFSSAKPVHSRADEETLPVTTPVVSKAGKVIKVEAAAPAQPVQEKPARRSPVKAQAVKSKASTKPAAVVAKPVKASKPDAVVKVAASKPKVTKPVASVVSKPVAKVVAKAIPKADIKPATKLAAKSAPAPKAAAKPSPAPVPKPVLSPPKKKTEAVTIQTPVVPTTAAAPAPVKPVAKSTGPEFQMTASGVPVRTGRPSSRLAQLTVPSMAQSVASTAAKSSFTQMMAPQPIVPPLASATKRDPKLANNWKTKTVTELTDAEVIAMPDEAYMNDTQLAFFRAKLVTLKNDILSNAGETTEHLREDTVVVPDPADRATIEEEHALELRTRDRERKLLKKIEQSIGRIDAGDYGYCDETGEAIGVGRLLARPTATLSLEAQQRRELKQRMFGD